MLIFVGVLLCSMSSSLEPSSFLFLADIIVSVTAGIYITMLSVSVSNKKVASKMGSWRLVRELVTFMPGTSFEITGNYMSAFLLIVCTVPVAALIVSCTALVTLPIKFWRMFDASGRFKASVSELEQLRIENSSLRKQVEELQRALQNREQLK